MGNHHSTRVLYGNRWVVARPLRDTSFWHRWKQERACRKTIGHCWHAEGFIEWWCCMCSAETDGMPGQRCKLCAAEEHPPAECQGPDFSKLLTALDEGLVAHADRDGLTGVMRAVFMSRGGHAPGTVCPTETPLDPHQYWCASPDDECNCGAAGSAP